nr:nucleotidyl transferase AbiEii/AbiGii toxin family protein [uncultured Desulfobulbus sp.]
MLQLKTVHKDTFSLLQELSSHEALNSFALAGGTALALHLGHRVSIDLDFFTEQTFDSLSLFEVLGESFILENCSMTTNSLSCFVNWRGVSVKVDLMRHNYPRLRPWLNVSGICLFALEDIAAMKLNAIANRGAKKDFYDIHALLTCFSLKDILGFFEKKYERLNSFTVTKSLAYFDDAQKDPDPLSLVSTSWSQIQADLEKLLRDTA